MFAAAIGGSTRRDRPVRISELSRRSGVPISSIKFYIRERLLPAGERRGPNQADYADEHLQRLDLIRALREVGGCSVDVTRHVLQAIDAPRHHVHPLDVAFGAIYASEPIEADREEYERTRAEIRAFLDALPWTIDGDAPISERELVDALMRIRRYAWADFPAAALMPYARIAWQIAAFEFEMIPGGIDAHAVGAARPEAVTTAVLGTMLFEPILLALRRQAHRARTVRIFLDMPLPPAE
jgi:DNA-binding transcriptional MerR regulator